jgi:hypothetical protein
LEIRTIFLGGKKIIGQRGGGFWTKPEISAKVGRESAKVKKYQPK